MPVLLFVAGALVALVGAVFAVGAREPIGHVATRSRRFPVPPERVWDAISQDQVPGSWTKLRYDTVESDPPRMLEKRIVGEKAFGGTWTWQLAPESDGTLVSITERGEVYSPFYRFVSRYVLGKTRTMDEYLDALERALA